MSEFTEPVHEDRPPVLDDFQTQAVAEAYQYVESRRKVEGEPDYEPYIMGVTADGRFVSVETRADGDPEAAFVVRTGTIDGMVLGERLREERVDHRPPAVSHMGAPADSKNETWLQFAAGENEGAQAGAGQTIHIPNEEARKTFNGPLPTIDGMNIYAVGQRGRPFAAAPPLTDSAWRKPAAPDDVVTDRLPVVRAGSPAIAGPEAGRQPSGQEQDPFKRGLMTKIERHFATKAEGAVVHTADGSEHMTLYMPWQGGGQRRPTVATLTLSRRVGPGGNSVTDMTFSAKGAWDSSVRVFEANDGRIEVIDAHRDAADVMQPVGDPRHSDVSTLIWQRNLTEATLERPVLPKGLLGRVLGRKALGN